MASSILPLASASPSASRSSLENKKVFSTFRLLSLSFLCCFFFFFLDLFVVLITRMDVVFYD